MKNIFKVFSCFVKWYSKGTLTAKLIGILKAYVLKVSSRHTKFIFKVKYIKGRFQVYQMIYKRYIELYTKGISNDILKVY